MRARPWSRSTCASQPSSAFVRDGSSAMCWTSPVRAGRWSASNPLSDCAASASTMSSTLVATPRPTLKAPRRRSRPPAGWRPRRRPRRRSRASAAVAEDLRPSAVEQLAAEDRDHPGLAERVLARAVDVAVAQRDGRQPVQAGEQRAVVLGAELGQAVGRPGRDRVVLRGGEDLALAVDRAAGGGVDQRRTPRPGRRSGR